MAVVTFLLTVTVLSASIYAGYRFNMYLYARGAVGSGSRQMRSIVSEPFPVSPVRKVAVMEERDYGLRYARIGILVIGSLAVALVVGLILAIFTVL